MDNLNKRAGWIRSGRLFASSLRSRCGPYAAVSLTVLLPCFWQRTLFGGDLGSHVYTAWLTTVVEAGKAPGVHVVHPWTNVVLDDLLSGLMRFCSVGGAEHLASALAVLAFFWSAFWVVHVISGRTPWFLAPLIGVLAYGWVFNGGVLNYYISVAGALFILALLWRPSRLRTVAAVAVAIVTSRAQVLPLVWVFSVLFYKVLFDGYPRFRMMLFVAALVVMVSARLLLASLFQVGWDFSQVEFTTGADQAYVFGREYRVIVVAILLLCAGILLHRWHYEGSAWTGTAVVHLYLLSALAAFILPSWIQFPIYGIAFTSIHVRLSLMTGVVGAAILGGARPSSLMKVGIAGVAVLFAVFLFRDAHRQAGFQRQVDSLVSRVPTGQRVCAPFTDRRITRLGQFYTMVSRACIGHCFDFGDYEAATRMFRLRADSGNSTIAWKMNPPSPIEQFFSTKSGMVLYLIDWCSLQGDRLCLYELNQPDGVRQLTAGP
jgi:hypothetical protein